MDQMNISSLSYTGLIGSDAKRNHILDTFNAEDNQDGDKFKVMMTTSAGTQGLTLLDTNYVHILEPHRSEMFIHQLIGRAVRFRSHERIADRRNYVKVYRYYTDLPELTGRGLRGMGGAVLEEKQSTDRIVKEKADARVKTIMPLLEMMKATSIDCDSNYEKDCYFS